MSSPSTRNWELAQYKLNSFEIVLGEVGSVLIILSFLQMCLGGLNKKGIDKKIVPIQNHCRLKIVKTRFWY